MTEWGTCGEVARRGWISPIGFSGSAAASIDAVEDEGARFLDLAAFAEGRLDPDERERVAEWLRSRPDAAGDIAAARALASGAAPGHLSETAVARACALVGGGACEPAGFGHRVPRQSRQADPFSRAIAQWGSLAAALVVAGWLGFTLGMDTSGMMAPGRAGVR